MRPFLIICALAIEAHLHTISLVLFCEVDLLVIVPHLVPAPLSLHGYRVRFLSLGWDCTLFLLVVATRSVTAVPTALAARWNQVRLEWISSMNAMYLLLVLWVCPLCRVFPDDHEVVSLC